MTVTPCSGGCCSCGSTNHCNVFQFLYYIVNTRVVAFIFFYHLSTKPRRMSTTRDGKERWSSMELVIDLSRHDYIIIIQVIRMKSENRGAVDCRH